MFITILLVLAFACFLLAAARITHPRIDLVAFGLACASLAWIVAGSMH